MTPWPQNYDPLGFWPASTLLASLPIVVLFYLLAFRRVGAARSAAGGAATALLIAVFAFGMPLHLAGASFLYGVAFGIVKIAWIVFSAVFLYDIAVASGAFEIMKDSIAAISADRRLQALIIAFSFGAFIEGAAGFGAPVAISAAFMVGLGFQPFYAAALCLIANTAPVAWGALGTPVHTLAAVTALPEADLNAMIGRILPFTSILVPFWLVRTMVSWKETFEVFPAILVTGLFFAVPQFYWSNYQDSNLVDIVAALVSLAAMVALLRFWKPRAVWRFPEEAAVAARTGASTGGVLRAWMPFVILSVFVFLWGLPSIKRVLNVVTPVFVVPGLHQGVARVAPVVAGATPEAALFDFNWLSATGTGCFLAAIVSGLALGLSPRTLGRTFLQTAHRMRMPLVAIACMLGLGFVTRYSGVDAVLGLACTRTGFLYPFFGTFLGWLGVALTGSDTSSNALFGSLQRITAEQLGFDPVLMAAANSSGGVMGKMVDAQSIVVATAATRQVGNEGRIFRFVAWHSIALGAIVGLIVMAYAFLFPQLVPHGLTFPE
ncbi:MAG TPA: L-lactate permease [Vicinamibacteria bacterium]|nr:L-lactate permease [Vicinamibacteria bacterium]